MLKTFVFSLALLMFIGCKKDCANSGISPCMQTQIDASLAATKGSLYYRIDAYKYQGNNVYLYYKGCCDRYDDLQDENCSYLFSPSGGIGGGGDHTHSDFFQQATFISTLWTDPRP